MHCQVEDDKNTIKINFVEMWEVHGENISQKLNIILAYRICDLIKLKGKA